MAQKRLFTDANLTQFYINHIKSETWKNKRRVVRVRSEGRCEQKWGTKRCPNQAQDVHHLTYANLGDERIADLLHVCRSCHDTLELHKREARKMKAVLSYAARKYGVDWPDDWSYDEIENEFDEWIERSGGQAA